jgi:demethylmenaquinone methyltransferase / 2-methoxy-6-polyprenyl-1,4-benzoquinol methylase
MSGKPSLTHQQQSNNRFVREMFTSIAGVYDLLNHLLSSGMDILWRKKAVRMLPCRQRELALDLCGGTGDFARTLLKKKKANAAIVADFALPMLSIAKKKLSSQKVCCNGVDAHYLPYRDGCFDMVLSAFGMRNITDLEICIADVRRVLKPGGEFLVLDFMGGQSGPVYHLFSMYFHYVLPAIGKLVSRDPIAYSYLPQSVKKFHSRDMFKELLESKGLQVKKQKDVLMGIATITLAVKIGSYVKEED